MPMQGMDYDLVINRDVKGMKDAAQRIRNEVIAHMESLIQNMVWEGPDAKQFKHQVWPNEVKKALLTAATTLDTAATTAFNNAKLQREVSEKL